MTPSPRREEDQDDEDYTDRRIATSEFRLGVGDKTLTVKGGVAISVILGIAILALIGFGINEQQKLGPLITREHDRMATTVNKALRLQTCVLSMTPDERIQWRQSRDTQYTLMAFCPGLLVTEERPENPQ